MTKTILNTIKLVILLAVLATINACNTSSLSSSSISNLSKLGVKIEILQDASNEQSNRVVVKLFDSKFKQINNKSIDIKLNGKSLNLNVHKGLYYTKTIRHIGKDYPIDNDYYFEIQLSDSTTHPLAYIQKIKTISPKHITLKKEGSINENTSIKWKNLKEFDSLAIWKSVKYLDKENSYGGGNYAKSTIKKIIKKKDSTYTVDTSFYKDSISTITRLHFDFHAQKEVLINPKLVQGSSISISSSISKTIEIKYPSVDQNNP